MKSHCTSKPSAAFINTKAKSKLMDMYCTANSGDGKCPEVDSWPILLDADAANCSDKTVPKASAMSVSLDGDAFCAMGNSCEGKETAKSELALLTAKSLGMEVDKITVDDDGLAEAADEIANFLRRDETGPAPETEEELWESVDIVEDGDGVECVEQALDGVTAAVESVHVAGVGGGAVMTTWRPAGPGG